MDDAKTARGLSPDGYITDQDCLGGLRYRGIPASINGCGPVAVFDLLRFLGRERPLESLLEEMSALHRVRFPGPTSLRVMRLILRSCAAEVRQTRGREAALAAAERSRAGIFRYREGHEPHFVCFLRREDGRFRFFNVADGLEDCVLSMADFGREHLRGGPVVVLTAD